MKILFDNGVPKPIENCLKDHEITHARQIGWHELRNGELIRQAEQAGYQILISTDKNMPHQQNLTGRQLAIVILGNQQWPDVQLHLERIVEAVKSANPGSFTLVEIPHRR